MYKAKINIGGYKVGEEVPADKAEVWMSMYKVSPVEKTNEKESSDKPQVVAEKESNSGTDSILHDYLARGKSVVVKNIKSDRLSNSQLEDLFLLESSGKKRKLVIDSIKKRLKAIN